MILISFVAQNFNVSTNVKSSRIVSLSNSYQSSMLMLYSKLYTYGIFATHNKKYELNAQSLHLVSQSLILNKVLATLPPNHRKSTPKLRSNLALSYSRGHLSRIFRSSNSIPIELGELKVKKITNLPIYNTSYNFLVLIWLMYSAPNSKTPSLGYSSRAVLL